MGFAHIFTWYLTHATHLINFLLPFNRFTVFLLKEKYQHFWGKYLKFFLGFCILFPICLVWHIPFQDIYLKPENASNPISKKALAQFHPEIFGFMNNPRNFAVLITLTSSFSFLMNIYVIIKLMKQRYCYNFSSSQGKVSPQDIKLTIYTMLIFATEIVNCAQQYNFIWVTDLNVYFAIFEAQAYIIDITCLAPAWFILITHKGLRQKIGSYFGCKFSNSIQQQQQNVSTSTQQQPMFVTAKINTVQIRQ